MSAVDYLQFVNCTHDAVKQNEDSKDRPQRQQDNNRIQSPRGITPQAQMYPHPFFVLPIIHSVVGKKLIVKVRLWWRYCSGVDTIVMPSSLQRLYYCGVYNIMIWWWSCCGDITLAVTILLWLRYCCDTDALAITTLLWWRHCCGAGTVVVTILL